MDQVLIELQDEYNEVQREWHYNRVPYDQGRMHGLKEAINAIKRQLDKERAQETE